MDLKCYKTVIVVCGSTTVSLKHLSYLKSVDANLQYYTMGDINISLPH